MNFDLVVAYLFCLALPAGFTQPGDQLLAEPYKLFCESMAVQKKWIVAASGECGKGVSCIMERSLPLRAQLKGGPKVA